jgi:hypothetical protein
MQIACAYCGAVSEKPVGAVNRAKAAGARLFCDRECAGFGRRQHKTEAQLKAEKRQYDAEYRVKNRAMLKVKKAARFKLTYDPVKAAVDRKKTMPRHVAYCRRPEYKKSKSEYDKVRRAKQQFGEFWEAFLALSALDTEIAKQATKYEIMLINGTLNKTNRRKRDYERTQRNGA